MIIINTGDGKGKTTAALGQALRAVGEGKEVLMIQFIKGPWKSGEDKSAKFLHPHFELRKMGKGFVGILGDTLSRAEHEKAAREALAIAKAEAEKGIWDMLILDEVNNALHLELISLGEVLDFIDRYPKDKHLILTGRDATEAIIERADIVTEMREIKHIFREGVKAKRGIEY
ncbi:MAG: cob(I)yrinic acid a,c-diamide adenosyltransferase [Candidatus Sungbacteria bacterium]|uniref:Cob(I)yrinic acid a,c-diamide adenosyltransferase n=1 Tax=Candidatus Sungiibacteriota bacterium TaxID=2750080 RepID=A0A931SD37_9BACT|nr:cob(I)yrinic acid a,c-diamide adenosyltransferase [Candidatus Sungbacteria bacterium]